MCGIYGMVALRGALRWPDRADGLADAVRERGPDAHGRHRAPDAVIGVHRLRVVDPTPAADQPFVTRHCVLAVNGEIYNATALRRAFPDHPWQSRSDAEPLVPLLADGDPAALRGVAGMFGLAHWDAATRTLTLARDRVGEKPLFYARLGNEVWFASSPAALAHHPQLPAALDRDAARDFLTLGVVRPPRTLRAGVHSVPPGTAVVFAARETRTVQYAPDVPPPRAVSAQAIAQALASAVERQLTADVPVGLFLSGGLDSSLVAALAAPHRPRMRAWTVGFDDPSWDERPYARRVARDLGLDLLTVTADTRALLTARDTALGLPEPIADPAVLPTILLAERAREHVTVVLSGEGADELFAGYPTYAGHRLAGRVPTFLADAALAVLPTRTGGRHMPAAWLLRRFLEGSRQPIAARHVAWFAGGLPPAALTAPCAPVRIACSTADPVALAMELDRTVWLPERLLVKLDRATMRVALEARAPFLDPTVVVLARSAGTAAHVGLRGKRLLRQVARMRVPPYILRRRKHGLSVPVGGLINGALRTEADRLLDPARVGRDGLVRPDVVTQLVRGHRAGQEHGRALWTLLTLEAWRERHGLDGP